MAEDLVHLAIIESAKDHDSAAVFGLRLPNKLLYKWYEEGKCDGCKLIKELNRSIVGNCVAIREDSERMNKLLTNRCRKIVSQCKSAKGRKKLAIMDGSTLVKVLHGEYQGNFNQGNFDDREEFEEISLKCDGLEKEIASLYKETARMTYERANSGKPMHELSPRHARRKLLEFKENAEVALWFAESYGLAPTMLQLETLTSHRAVQVDLRTKPPPAIPIPDDPAPDEKNKLLQVNRTLTNTHICTSACTIIYRYM